MWLVFKDLLNHLFLLWQKQFYGKIFFIVIWGKRSSRTFVLSCFKKNQNFSFCCLHILQLKLIEWNIHSEVLKCRSSKSFKTSIWFQVFSSNVKYIFKGFLSLYNLEIWVLFKSIQGEVGGFHLYLSELAFSNQF